MADRIRSLLKDTLAVGSGCFGHIFKRNQGWETLSAFESFVLSQNFNTFLGHIGPLLTEPAKPQFFVTDTNPDKFASASFTEITQLPVKSEHPSRDKDWERLSSLIKVHSRGESINLGQQLWLGIIGWENVEERGSTSCLEGCVTIWGTVYLTRRIGNACKDVNLKDFHPISAHIADISALIGRRGPKSISDSS
ncbi:hypothetical protein V2W45_1507211 [Cenococcum geophilum]